MREIRYLNEMIDEGAKGKAMEKILRQPQESSITLKPFTRRE